MVVARAEIQRLRPSAFAGLQPDEAALIAGIPVQLFNRLSRSRAHIAEFIPATGGPHAREDAVRLRDLLVRSLGLVIPEMGQTVADFLSRSPKSILNSTKPLVNTLVEAGVPTATKIGLQPNQEPPVAIPQPGL